MEKLFEQRIKRNINKIAFKRIKIVSKQKPNFEQKIFKQLQTSKTFQYEQQPSKVNLKTSVQPLKLKKNKSKSGWFISLCTLFLISFVYLLGVFYFQKHLLIGTSILDTDVSFKKVKDATSIVEKQIPKRSLHVQFDNSKSLDVKYSDANYISDIKADVTTIMKKQNPYLWFIPNFKKLKLTQKIHLERELLVNKYQTKIVSLTKPLNLSEFISYSPKQGQYIIKNNYLGSNYLVSNIFNEIYDSIKSGETNVKIWKSSSVSNQIKELVNNLNKILKNKLNITFGNVVDNIDSQYIVELINFSNSGVIVDIDKLASTLQFLAKQHEHVESGKITTYNYLNLITQIKNDLESIKLNNYQAQQNILPLGKNEGKGTLKLKGTYIEVNVGFQQMYVWKNSSLIKIFNVVTGDHLKGRDTPPGIWELWAKQKNKVLMGNTVGSGKDYDYKIPVKYWMPIDFTGVGLHSIDVDEVSGYHGRSYWGKDAYLIGRGSHGCVNMHTPDAGWVFDNMPLKTKVYVTY